MNILGLNGWVERGHDGGASIISNGKLLLSIEEERLSRLRHAYDSLPLKSIKEALRITKIKLDEIDRICIGWNYPSLFKMIGKKFITKKEMSKCLFNTDKYADKIFYINHHEAHAYSAFYPSNYEEALVLVIDGQGEVMGTSIYKANRHQKKMGLLYETPVSLGYFYSAISEHIGFKNGEEGKTMGLASYGRPLYIDKLREIINIDNNGNLNCLISIKKVNKDEEEETIEKWHEYLEKILPRRKGKIIEVNKTIMPYANLASSAQKLLEEILTKLVTIYYKKTKLNKIAIAGGVGLNCPSSTAIEELPFIESVFVQPAANDGGISLGAAIKGAIDLNDEVSIEMIPYLGPEYSSLEILKVLNKYTYSIKKYKNIEKKIARLLYEGKIIGNFQGRLELGPRALGNRSLLADPRKYEMLVKMNNLKGREVWRPLAPAVLYDKQKEFFSSDTFSPFMIKNCLVLKEKRNLLQAITHVDNTARIQSVTMKYNKRFYNTIKEFYKLSSVPVLINTSFNVRGEPIVCTPKEAIESAIKMNLDYLAIEDYLVKLKN
ncbi:MAG: carbamoyltransferase C-terminal domain-containing protein [Bacilli bacterium]